jgi:alkylation response protein AidB-like acyl-CoA dehydrogenase
MSDNVFKAIEKLAPGIAERAAEIEAARRLPVDIVDQLSDAGAFGILRPVTHGGSGADLPTGLRLFETLAAIDGSVGWTVMIGGVAWADVAGLSRAVFDSLFAGGRGVLAGAFNPMHASITAVDGGYRVTGRWSFASGCQHADWLFGNAIAGFTDEGPQMRMAVFAPDQVTIEDTWHVAGLCGTGSHHFSVEDVFVPAERTLVPMVDPSCIDAPITHIGPPPLIGLSIASVALGIAAGALGDIVDLAEGKVPLLSHGALATNALFQRELAEADATLRAARAMRDEVSTDVWRAVAASEALTLDERARIRASCVWIVEHCGAVVDTAYRNGLGSSLYAASPLQRRLRDIHVLSQHFLVKRDTYTTAGAILAGQGLSDPSF